MIHRGHSINFTKKTVIFPPHLKPGDCVYITAPAKSIDQSAVDYAAHWLEKQGYRVQLSAHCVGQHHYFSGTDEQRRDDMQRAIDDPEIKAIWCARGGYGSVRIVDQLNWETFFAQPKWLIGFSDITVFHQHLQKNKVCSIHATMPLNVASNSNESLDSLVAVLNGHPRGLQAKPNTNNILGSAEGGLIGGNLSVLCSLIGTDAQPDFTGKILFIEDLAEHLYQIDRMMYSLKKSGILKLVSAVVVGGMTDLKDTSPPFGLKYEQIIREHVEQLGIPIAFDFPAGHINDNQALLLGAGYSLNVDATGVRLEPRTTAKMG